MHDWLKVEQRIVDYIHANPVIYDENNEIVENPDAETKPLFLALWKNVMEGLGYDRTMQPGEQQTCKLYQTAQNF